MTLKRVAVIAVAATILETFAGALFLRAQASADEASATEAELKDSRAQNVEYMTALAAAKAEIARLSVTLGHEAWLAQQTVRRCEAERLR